MAKKKSKKINWGGGAGFYDPSDKTKINSSVKNEQYKKSLEKKNTTKSSVKTNNNKSSESSKNTPTAKSGGGSSSTQKSGIEVRNQKQAQREAKIAENHQKQYEVNPFKSSNKSVNKAIQTSIDQNAMRNGNKTSDADAKAKIQNEVFKQKRAELEKSVNNAKTTVSNAVKKQGQTIKENFTDSELRQKRLNENSQANIDLADAQTALSRNGQVDNPTWKNKKTTKINLNDATQVSKLNKKATESSETVQKNLDRNALLGVIADTNASYVKGVENAVSSGLQSPANALATVGRVVGSNTLQDKAGGFAQDMYNATAAADKAMQDNNSVYSNAIGQTFSSVGNMLPQTLLGLSLGAAGLDKDAIQPFVLGLMGANVYGGEMSSAMNNYMAQNNAEKYSDINNDMFTRANLYALASAGKEVLTELVNDKIPGYKKLNINEILEEGLEEVYGGLAEPYINQILTAKNGWEGFIQGSKELGESFTSGDLAKQGIMGSASALLANTPYSIAKSAKKARVRSANNQLIQEYGTETEKNFARVVSDYNLAKENYGITKNDTSKSIIDKTQYNINHDNGVISDYMVNNSNETFRRYARNIQAEAIRNSIGSERTNQQTNAFIKSVNDNNLAVEFADNVNINGEKAIAKLNGENGITFDKSILKDKSINLDEALRQTLEKGYALNPNNAYQNDEVTPTTEREQYGTDTIDLGTAPNGMTNEQKNQVLADRRAMYEQGMNAFKLRSPQERADFESDRQTAQDLNERAKKASDTGNKAELGNVLRESSNASEETKQAVKETVREDNKKAAKEITGKDIDDNLADAVTDVAQDAITKAYKGVRDAAQGKHGENAEQRANAREASESNEFRYETAKDADTLKSAQERIDAFKKDGKLDVNSSNEMLKDIKKAQENSLKSTRKDGYLSNEHQYEQEYVTEATIQLADIENSYRIQLEKQGLDVTRNFDKNGVSYVVKDAEGNEIHNELTKALQDSATNATEARKLVLEEVSKSAVKMRNMRKLWSSMPKEEKIYDLQKLVKDTQAMIDKNGLNKNGEHILQIDAELMKQFDAAENNSTKQGELFDEIIKDLARQTPRKFSDKINAYRNISMLLSIPTNLRNVVGNLTSEYLSKFSNIGSSVISLALDKAGYFQKAELDLTDAKNKYYYDFSNKVVANAVKEIMNKNSNVKADGILAKDIKKWKGGADNVDAFLNRNADFMNRLQHNVGTKLVEMAKQEGALTKNGHFTTKFLKDNADSIQKMVVESYNQSAKAKALMSESSFLREDGTLAKATKANKEVAKQFLKEIGGEEGATGDFNGRFASGDALGDTGNNVDAKGRFNDAFREETFVGRESKVLQKYLGKETGNMTHDALAKAAKAVFGDDFNVGIMHNAEKLTNWLLNNSLFGDSAFFRSSYANEWARYIDSKGYTASVEKGENGTVYKFTDKNGKVLDDTKANALMDKANAFSVIEAQEAVFHQASGTAEIINKFKQRGPMQALFANAVMPFAKTPINIAKNSVTYSPIGLMKGVYEMTKGVQSGRCTADQAIRHLSKGMTGSSIMVLGAYLFSQGILNGTTGDDDKDSFEESRGKQSYSLNLPNGTYSLSWLSVANVPLFTGVNAMQTMMNGGFSLTDALDAVSNIADPIVNASFMSGLLSTLKDLGGRTNYDDKDADVFAKVVTNVVKTYVTQFFPSAGKHINTVLNQYKKSTYDDNTVGQILNSAQTAIPFMAANLQNQVDVYGNDVENVGGDNPILRALYTYLSIGTYKPYDKTYGKEGDSYTNKLEKIAEVSGDSNVLPYVSSSIQGTKMNAKERHDLNQYMLKNYNDQVHSLFESGILDGYNLDNKEDAAQVAELLGKIKSHYFYEAKAKLYKRTNPSEADSVLTDATKTVDNLDKKGIPVYLSKYLQSQQADTDANGNSISLSKPLRNRRLLETLGKYDDVMSLYKKGEISDLYNVGLSSTVVKMSQQQYEDKLDDLDNGLLTGYQSKSDDERRDDTFSDLEENQKFADALTAHDIDYGVFANYKTIKGDKKDGKTVMNSRAEKIIAQMEKDGVLEGFKEGIRDGSFNYDNITQFGLTSKQVEKLLGLEVQKTSDDDDDDSSSGSSSSGYSRRSRSSSRRSSGSRRSSSSSSSSTSATEETPTFDLSGALKAINKGASKTSSGLTQSQLQSLYNSTVSNHNSRISSLQTLVNKGKK